MAHESLAIPPGVPASLVEDAYPLSPMQQGMLYHSVETPRSNIYTVQAGYRLTGPLDTTAFVEAWRRVVRRHVVLRSAFHWTDDGEPIQLVHRDVDVAVREIDWRSLTEPEQQRRLLEVLEEEAGQPFDLASPPLWRLSLYAGGANLHYLVLSHHHILFDGSCKAQLFDETFAAYDALGLGRPSELPESRPYRLFIDWLRHQDLSTAERFWRNELVGFSSPTALPESSRPHGLPSREHDAHVAVLETEHLPPLRAFLRRHRLTLSTLLGAAWSIVLARVSGDRDVVFGMTVNCRPPALPEADEMVGLFINTLPVRVRVTPEAPLVEWLKGIQTHQAGARDYDFAPLMAIQRWSTIPRGQALFDTIVVVENNPGYAFSGRQYGSLQMQDVHAISRNSLPLSIMCLPASDSLTMRFAYDARRFSAEIIEHLSGQLIEVLGTLGSRENETVSSVLAVPESTRVPQTPDATPSSDRTGGRLVHELFERWAAATPDAPAVACEGECLTYREVNGRANRLARYLQTLGAGPDGLVGLHLERSVDLIVGMMGVLKAGAAYVPLDPTLPQNRLLQILDESRAQLVVSHRRVREALPAIGRQVVTLDADWERICRELPTNVSSTAVAENLVYVLFTSGSTGRPKGVAVEHRQLARYVESMQARLDLPAGATYATVTTFAADLGNTSIFPALASGGCLHIVTESCASDPEAFAEYAERWGIDMLKIVPSHLRALLTASRPERVVPRQRLVLGGEPCPWQLVSDVRRLAARCVVFNHYGPTETTIGATTHRVESDEMRALSATVPIGRPLPHATTYVVDAEGRQISAPGAGELYIGGASVARGYLHAPEQTAEHFVTAEFGSGVLDRVYKTGDRVRLLPTGDLEFIGRIDDQVKIRGFRVELGEIERVCARHPDVSEAAVIAIDMDAADKRVAAFIVPRPGARVSDSDVRAFVSNLLPEYMVPLTWTVLTALPLTPNGKIDRKALPPLVSSPAGVGDARVDSDSAWEAIVRDIWQDLLQTEIDPNDNFYDLGGHSLMAMQVVTRLQKRTGLRVGPRDLLFHTMRQFAALCESKMPLDRGSSAASA
jgi:amino acid adenylation domain-containing protein